MKKSGIRLIAEYARDIKGMNTFTARQLFNLSGEALGYYFDQIPDREKQHNEILNKYGFTPESWREVLIRSGSLFFIPDTVGNSCNKELKKFYDSYPHIASEHQIPEYTSAEINNARKRGYLEYADKSKRPFTYKLTDKN